MELRYVRCGDYYIPDLILEKEEPVFIGKYGRMRKVYLKEHRPILYEVMILEGRLNKHLAEIDQSAHERVEWIIEGLLKSYPAPDKATKPLEWAAHMNSLKAMAEESVFQELIYS